MLFKNTTQIYGGIAKSFHWLIALLILCMLAIGFYMKGLPISPDKFKLYGLHKSTGITILTLAALRLIWREINLTPLLPSTLKWWEKVGAHASHALLYVLMFAMPLSGWAMSSASGFPVSVFDWFTLPNLVQPDKELKETLIQLHFLMAWALIAVITLHVLAALLHHFYYKDNVLVRMSPFVKGTRDALDSNATRR